MFWYLPHKDFNLNKGEGNHNLMEAMVKGGDMPGLIAYHDGLPIGWCAIGPRSNYSGLSRSRILRPVDNDEVWSIPCFFVEKKYRRMGVTLTLIIEAIKYAERHGVKILEGYPTDSSEKQMPAPFVYTGLASTFIKAGFREVARRSEKRPIMRLFINSGK